MTRVTIFTFPIEGYAQILEANPNRRFVRFELGDGAGVQDAIPGPPPEDYVNNGSDLNMPKEFKFWDCPSIVTGEWYGRGMVATRMIITECIRVG